MRRRASNQVDQFYAAFWANFAPPLTKTGVGFAKAILAVTAKPPWRRAGWGMGCDAMINAALPTNTPDAPARGIVLLVVGLSFFSLQDVMIRFLSGGYSVLEILFLRGLVAISLIVAVAASQGNLRSVVPNRWRLHVVRGVLSFVCFTAYYLALVAMPLAEVSAITFTMPLFLTAFSVPFLGEQVGVRRWCAVVVGLTGILFIMRPGVGVMDPAALLAVVAAITYAFTQLLVRRMAPTENAVSMVVSTVTVAIVSSAVVGLVFTIGDFGDAIDHRSYRFLAAPWVIPVGGDMVLIAAIGLITAVGFYMLTECYRISRASVLAPFEYSYLPWAILWGYVFWKEVPDGFAMVGIALVAGSGLYVVHRESVRGRRMVTGRSIRPPT